jgi:hypothetical protein
MTAMLALESAEWQELGHAYGPASDIPDLLRRLAQDTGPKTGFQEEPWHSLWSSLCHQGDVYAASYAAIPHIVDIALGTTLQMDLSFFLLPTCVEIARAKGRGPGIPPALELAYRRALRRLLECAIRHTREDWDNVTAVLAMAAMAAAKGRTELAEAMIELDDDVIRRINEGELR